MSAAPRRIDPAMSIFSYAHHTIHRVAEIDGTQKSAAVVERLAALKAQEAA
jgi:hypothetical protein